MITANPMSLREAIKSVPVVGPLATHLNRRVRRYFEQRKEARQATNLRLFRQFCAEAPALFPNPLFVKVGANDGITGDPCSDILINDLRWKGLLIEPVPYCFTRLERNFNDRSRFRLERVAVGPTSGLATFYYVAAEAKDELTDLPDWFDQIGSFDRAHIVKHLGGRLEPFIREMDVEVKPLTGILQRNGLRDCQLLHIDTEGHDYRVLLTLDFAETTPAGIFIEHKHLGDLERSLLLNLLRRLDYVVKDCGTDYFALQNSTHKDLMRRRASGA